MAFVPRYEVPTPVRVAWNVGVAFYTGLVGLLLLLDRELPADKWKWVHGEKLQIVAVAVLIVVSLADAIRRAVVRTQEASAVKVQVQVRNTLAAAMATVADNHNLSVSELGCGLFLVKPRGLRKPERLIRPARVRIPDDLAESPVSFTKGKGAVGQTWEHAQITHNDWIAINRKYASNNGLIDRRWTGLSEKVTRGFTPAEFKAVVGKYAEVIAVPMVSDGKLVGCVALDRRWRADDDGDVAFLDTDTTKKVLGAAAKTLAADLAR